jgi:hypothetical protein
MNAAAQAALPESSLRLTTKYRLGPLGHVGLETTPVQIGVCGWHQFRQVLTTLTPLVSKPTASQVVELMWQLAYALPTPSGVRLVERNVRNIFVAIRFDSHGIVDQVAKSLAGM